MFPGPGAQVYYNDAGEPLGWDYPSEPDPYDYDDSDPRVGAAEAASEEAYERGYDDGYEGADHDSYSGHEWLQSSYDSGYADGRADSEGGDT